jgi:pilus assembly protein TadC
MSQSGGWQQVITALSSDPGYLLGAIAIVLSITGFVAISVTATISTAWHRVRVNEELANLKLQMLARGMSAEEVVKVVEANNSSIWARRGKKKWCDHDFKQPLTGRSPQHVG